MGLVLLFPKSMIAPGVILPATAWSVIRMIQSGAFWFWPVFTGIMGILLALFALLFAASASLQKVLDILYQKLDPVGMTEKLEPVLQHLKAGSPRRPQLTAHLSNAYGAAGDYECAFSILDDMERNNTAKEPNLEALVLSNRCALYLQQENTMAARASLDQLTALISGGNGRRLNPKLAAGAESLRLRLSFLEGAEDNLDYLFMEIRQCNNPLRRVNFRYLLARVADRKNDWNLASAQYEKVAKAAPKLAVGKNAGERLKALSVSTSVG